MTAPLMESHGVKLCGVKVSGRASRPLIQIFADWEEGGITIDACAKLTRALLDLFDMEERFVKDYRLEVSSPGIDWPLREAWQFRKNIGRVIMLRTAESEFQGKILDVTAEGLVKLEISGETTELTVASLSGAKVVLSPKPSQKSGWKRNEARSR